MLKMDSTTTTTLSRIPERAHRRQRGFTLVEILVSAGISAFILTGVLTSFLFLGRSGANLQNYTEMDAQARKAMELFAEDVRQASSATWSQVNSGYGADKITLKVGGVDVAYSIGTRTRNGSSSLCLIRTISSVETILISGIVAPSARTSETDTTCTPIFRAYTVSGNQITGIEYANPSAATLTSANTNTKQIQISLESTRTSSTAARATNNVISARFILRNKIVTA